jgi:hypothetical protein
MRASSIRAEEGPPEVDPELAHYAIDGKPPRQLTHFTDGRPIGTFAWSRDGKRLAIGRLTVTNDIVLFTGLGK